MTAPSAASTVLYSGEYAGPRWRYAFPYRPPQVGFTCPREGAVYGSMLAHRDYPHGTLDYARALTPGEVRTYQLVLVAAPEDAPLPVVDTPAGLRQLVDTLTVELHHAEAYRISERSHQVAQDLQALRKDINRTRVSAGLGPSPVSPDYPEGEG